MHRAVIIAIFLVLASRQHIQAQQVANMAGNWQISAQSTVFPLSFSAVGPLGQSGGTVSGQLTATGTPCASLTPQLADEAFGLITYRGLAGRCEVSMGRP